MQVLRARLLKLEQDRQAAELSDARRSQVGGGGRSEKIRTYNFKENRVTDHRIGLTLYKLDKVLAGELDERHRRARRRRAGPPAGRRPLADAAVVARPDASTATPRLAVAAGGAVDRRAGVGRATSTARARRTVATRGATSSRWSRAGRRASRCSTCSAVGFRDARPVVDRRVLIPGPRPSRWSSTRSARPAALGRPAQGRDRRPRHGVGRDRAVAGCRAADGRAEVWATDVSADALAVARANLAGLGRPRRPCGSRRGSGSTRCPRAAGRARPDRVEPALRRVDRRASRRGRATGSPRRRSTRGRPASRRSSTSCARRPRGCADGVLVVEIGESQGDAVLALARAAGFTAPRSTKTSPAATASSSPRSDPPALLGR